MRLQAVIGDAVSAADWLRSVAELAIVLAPAMEEHGVATADEIGGDTLADRITREVADNNSTIVGRAEIGAWVRVGQ